jgi:hypothetical protein
MSKEVFTRIIACQIAKKAWNKLKVEFHGDKKKFRKMQILNFRRQFKALKMKETKILKDF